MKGLVITIIVVAGIVFLAFLIPEYITYLRDKFKN